MMVIEWTSIVISVQIDVYQDDAEPYCCQFQVGQRIQDTTTLCFEIYRKNEGENPAIKV